MQVNILVYAESAIDDFTYSIKKRLQTYQQIDEYGEGLPHVCRCCDVVVALIIILKSMINGVILTCNDDVWQMTGNNKLITICNIKVILSLSHKNKELCNSME